MKFLNVAAYKFVTLDAAELPALRCALKDKAFACELKGTILLSAEGINLFLAGTQEKLGEFRDFLASFSAFQDLWFKESFSDYQPFTRMLVRLKKEIISMGHREVQPEKKTAPYVSPEQLKSWYESKKDMIVLDTRNDYEIELGAFDEALDLNLDTFRGFPDAVAMLPKSLKQKTIVTYCTGGIRCEKAAEYLLQQGYENVYQLEGGILNYFEKCGGEHYQGECFVFDKRVALDPELKETQTAQCYACRAPLPPADQRADGVCPYCQQHALGQTEVAAGLGVAE